MHEHSQIHTNHGTIEIEFFDDDAPKTVENFRKLAADKFYDGLSFHRVIPDFMIQGGCPQGTGTGGPGYTFEDEFNQHKVVRGALAMANAGPNTNGSQFFIVTTDAAPWLDGKHTVFGQVTDGMDAVDAIEAVPTDGRDRPEEPVVIESVELGDYPEHGLEQARWTRPGGESGDRRGHHDRAGRRGCGGRGDGGPSASRPAGLARARLRRARARSCGARSGGCSDNAERVIGAVVDETGKTYEDAQLTDLGYTVAALGFWAKHGRALPGRRARALVEQPDRGRQEAGASATSRSGVVGVIGPWNFPIVNGFGDCIPALMAGNSVILKPSEVTPLSSLLMAEMFAECGLPEDVFQVATGDGATGAALIAAGRLRDVHRLDAHRAAGRAGGGRAR